MNKKETIEWLADVQSTNMYPKRRDQVNETIPFFEIFRNNFGRYDMNCYNYEQADNAPRMPFVKNYLTHQILPFLSSKCDVSGFYNIQLHDSYCYLNDSKDYTNVFTFTKFKIDKGPVLLPDSYMMGNWGNQLNNISDNLPWESKQSKIIWKGTTTGNTNPKLNQRIKTCLWGLTKPDITEFNITNIAQMSVESVLESVPNFRDIYGQPMNQNEQMKFRYHLSMDGNTCNWSVWPYCTKSLVFKYKSPEMLWYYPIMQNKTHFVEVDIKNMEDQFQYYENNQKEAEFIIKNANEFSKSMFNPLVTQNYTIRIFENISQNR